MDPVSSTLHFVCVDIHPLFSPFLFWASGATTHAIFRFRFYMHHGGNSAAPALPFARLFVCRRLHHHQSSQADAGGAAAPRSSFRAFPSTVAVRWTGFRAVILFHLYHPDTMHRMVKSNNTYNNSMQKRKTRSCIWARAADIRQPGWGSADGDGRKQFSFAPFRLELELGEKASFICCCCCCSADP